MDGDGRGNPGMDGDGRGNPGIEGDGRGNPGMDGDGRGNPGIDGDGSGNDGSGNGNGKGGSGGKGGNGNPGMDGGGSGNPVTDGDGSGNDGRGNGRGGSGGIMGRKSWLVSYFASTLGWCSLSSKLITTCFSSGEVVVPSSFVAVLGTTSFFITATKQNKSITLKAILKSGFGELCCYRTCIYIQ